ncbi:hypothetical protein ARMGADRAFT_1031222 [Armillaria gallica]|uniref:Uncharacterized protein n=1 Tax=Armillaria gallica TaxID=47427 RepID=A0A2H3DY12_ARMGA|nr:hypothetical protein ARMGADRAFT_1031222 [Armillaria gallica]
MPAPPTGVCEAVLNAEMEAEDVAEKVEGVVDDAWVEEPNAMAEAELAQALDPDTEPEPDLDADLEAHLAEELVGSEMEKCTHLCKGHPLVYGTNKKRQDLGKGGAKGTKAGVNVVGDNILAVEAKAKDQLMSLWKGFTWFAIFKELCHSSPLLLSSASFLIIHSPIVISHLA